MRKIVKQSSKQSDKSPRNRWLTIGPGIVLALILAIQIVIGNRQKPTQPPIIERVVGTVSERKLLPAPEIGYLLERRERLGLNDPQVKRLMIIQNDWQVESKPLTTDLKNAADQFNAFMKEAGHRRVAIGDVQSHAMSVSELSRKVSSVRRKYWERAMGVLSSKQRVAVNQELAHTYRPKTLQPTGGIDR